MLSKMLFCGEESGGICEYQSVFAHKVYLCVAFISVFAYVDILNTVYNMSCVCRYCGQASCHTAVSCDRSV